MPEATRTVTAREAAALLGVSLPTLYAYVSRGLLRSEPGEGGTRARRYRRDDIDTLRARKEVRREPARAAEGALDYGMPVLDSAITLIDDGRLFYRGHDALQLAQERSFEEVAALLWTGDFAADALFAGSAPGEGAAGAARDLPAPAHPIERCQAALALAAVDDLAAWQYTPLATARAGSRILHLLTGVISGAAPAQFTADPVTGEPGTGAIARALAAAWAPESPDAAALLSAALILCADHELNVSAFTARCVASAGSPPYAVVLAALSALQGYKHGGHTAQAAALLAAAEAHGARAAVADRLREGDRPAGFGHVLYPDGDPRARWLLAALAARHPQAASVQAAGELCAVVEAALGLHPTVDLALAALAAALAAPAHSPLAIFALGRTAGWIAHAIEQYALDAIIRPRARYVGVRV